MMTVELMMQVKLKLQEAMLIMGEHPGKQELFEMLLCKS
jgi:hypothetical protein